ncbi:MAG: tetratricopeptide repeat protein, partial [Polyangiales bacterium]
LTLGPSPRERARAESVLAAVDARQGHTAAAIRRYATLAARYANTATGEDALFQAAALSLKAGQRGHAKELLGRYLARYPRGRRRAVVEQRLRSLRR